MRVSLLGTVQPKSFDWVNHISDEDHNNFNVLGLLANNNGSYLFPPNLFGNTRTQLPNDRLRLLLSSNCTPDYFIQTSLGAAPVREAVFYHQRDGYNCGPYSIMHALSITGQPTNYRLTTDSIREVASRLRVEFGQIPLSEKEWFRISDIRNVLRETVSTRCKTALSTEQKNAFDPNGTHCISFDELESLLTTGQISCLITSINDNHAYTCIPLPNSRFIIIDSFDSEPEVITADPRQIIREWSLQHGEYYKNEIIIIVK
jgi:hypothetical protein